MKKSIITLLIVLNIIAVNAGKLKGKIQKPGDNGMISFSLNGNGGMPMSSGVSNAFSFNPNAGVEVSWGNFGLGIDASTFTTKSNFDFDAYSTPLRALDFLTITGSGSSWKSTSFAFGPSYSFSLRSVKPISGVGIVVKHNYPKATVRLSIKGGITMNEAPDFLIMNNVSRKAVAAYSPPTDFKKNALTLIPSIRFNYWLSHSIALSANVQYAMQTGQTAFKTGYKDLSNVNISTPISPDQFTKNISSAPDITTTTVGPDKYLSVGAGLIISFRGKGRDGSINGNKKGITENGLKMNEAEYILADAEVKAIAETLMNMRKGWDGTVKGGNIAEKKGINEKGLKKNEAKSENINLQLTSTAQTLVNLARKGWDGTVKGGNFDNEADIMTVTETLENIRKGWDGSIKGKKTDYVANEADVKAIAETLVNLRKGWDGSIKGNRKGINENGLKKNEFDANTTQMIVPHTGKAKPKNGLKVAVMGSGQTNSNGTPIIDGKTVNGSLFSDKTKKNAFVEVSISQAESGDKGSAITDENGNFSIELNHDTLHTIFLNGVEFGKIKLTESEGWDGSVKGNKKGITQSGIKKNESARKGWDGTIKGSNVSIPINGEVIHVQTTPDGCIVMFADNGFNVNSRKKTMTVLSKKQFADFGERIKSGLHAAGGALAQGASLLGGALPGGAVISAAVSNVSSNQTDGASSAANTKSVDKKKKKVWDSGRDDNCDGLMNLPDGDYEIEVIFENIPTSKSSKAEQTAVTIEFSTISNVLKTKHDTVKNSINNVR